MSTGSDGAKSELAELQSGGRPPASKSGLGIVPQTSGCSDGTPKAYGDTTREYYDQNALTYAHSTQDTDLGSLWIPFAAALTAGAAVADLGCGGGRDLRQLALLGFQPMGLDLSHPLCRIAMAFSSRPVVGGDLTMLPFRAGVFGGVWCTAALLHLSISDARRSLVEIHRVLEPGGLLLLTLKEATSSLLDRADRRVGISSARHDAEPAAAPWTHTDEHGRRTTYYSEGDARSLLTENGFTDLELARSTEIRGAYDIQWLALLARRSRD